MKNKVSNRLVNVFSRIFNFRFWSDWERMKVFTSFVGEGYRRLFMLQPKEANQESALTESFEKAQQQFKLTNEQLQKLQKNLYRISLLMTVIAFLILLYSLYLFYQGSIRGGLLSLVVVAVALAIAFRHHFWYFQIKNRKLGCSIYEWYRKGLLGAKE